MGELALEFEGGEATLSVRRFSVHEGMSTPFTVSIWARSPNASIDINGIVGQTAGFRVLAGMTGVAGGGARTWSGLVSYMEQVRGEQNAHAGEQSLYYFRIVPSMWLLGHRSDHRVFQHQTIPDIVTVILEEWGVEHTWRVDSSLYPKQEYRVQYGETDFDFVSRLLEEAGIAYAFQEDGSSTLILSDNFEAQTPRASSIQYVENPTQSAQREYICRVEVVHETRPGAVTLRDYDYRRPAYPMRLAADKAQPEADIEQYIYRPGISFVEVGPRGGTPNADDKAFARHDVDYGKRRAQVWLESLRADRALVGYESNVSDLLPGLVFRIDSHPHPDLKRSLLVVSKIFEGTAEGEWVVIGHAVFADLQYRPPLATPRPEIVGVQVARVVGPRDEEIHTDEYGRVRVQFPWDRKGQVDDNSSCWMRVGEGWGGEGYGFIDIPRVGQEVVVSFLGSDPDRPVLVGRTYHAVNPVPYLLPDFKTVSTWKSRSYPGADGGWFNEIKYEDDAHHELFYLQAQKDLRALVKNDEAITVGSCRDKIVIGLENEVTGVNRTLVTGVTRSKVTSLTGTRVIVGDDMTRVVGDMREVVEKNRLSLVKGDEDVVVKGNQRERIEYDLHTHVVGNRNEHVQKTHSLVVLEQMQEKVGQTYSRESGAEYHVVAGDAYVGEAPDITVKGPGGFLRIDATGITISGTIVDINTGGGPGHGHGTHPADAIDAVDSVVPTRSLWQAAPEQMQAITAAIEERVMFTPRKDETVGPTALALVKFAMSFDVSSPLDGGVFWSGGADFAGAAADQFIAKQAAASLPATRLERTEGGGLLASTCGAIGQNRDGTHPGAPWTEQHPAWRVISQRYAMGVSGHVHVIVGKVPAGADAIVREEAVALVANKKVTKITFLAIRHDNGVPVKDEHGNFVLDEVSAADVLAPAPEKAK